MKCFNFKKVKLWSALGLILELLLIWGAMVYPPAEVWLATIATLLLFSRFRIDKDKAKSEVPEQSLKIDVADMSPARLDAASVDSAKDE